MISLLTSSGSTGCFEKTLNVFKLYSIRMDDSFVDCLCVSSISCLSGLGVLMIGSYSLPSVFLLALKVRGHQSSLTDMGTMSRNFDVNCTC